jgi:hypothetical protein
MQRNPCLDILVQRMEKKGVPAKFVRKRAGAALNNALWAVLQAPSVIEAVEMALVADYQKKLALAALWEQEALERREVLGLIDYRQRSGG